ncbi:MAG: alginate export family protein [Thermodesulfobacteriota bacterium]|nr:alginate export family protein [Thermodesulfobacteriota bacterium]
MKKFNVFLTTTIIVSIFATLCLFTPVQAEINVIDNDNAHLGLTLEAGSGYFYNDSANFGAGRFGDGEESVDWQEGYFKPILNGSYTTAGGTVYGGLSYVGSITRGDGDVAEFTSDSSEGGESELMYLGWESDMLFAEFGEDVLDISIGEQEFAIGDGFLIMDGAFDCKEGAYWLAPHRSFDQTAIIKLNTEPVRADFFYLESDGDYEDTELYGVNVEYAHTIGVVGATWLQVADVKDGGFYENRDGMNVYSIRYQGNPLASLENKDLFVAFEYAIERSGDNLDVDAEGWYAEAGYTFSTLPWTPTLSYRYAFFSGDEDSSDGDYESFDPMFYGFSRGWGTHFMGEITGEYYLFNSNEKVHMLHLNAVPSDKISIGALYFDFRLDEKNMFGTALTDDKFAEEVNVYMDYSINEYLYLSAVAAWATPGDAAEEYTGGDDDTTLFEIFAVVTF